MTACLYCLIRPSVTHAEPRCRPCDDYLKRVPSGYELRLQSLAHRYRLDREGRHGEVTIIPNYINASGSVFLGCIEIREI